MRDAERRSIELEGQPIGYTLIRSRRRRKTLEINIDPIDGVRVAVPARTPIHRIEEFVRSRSGWIRGKQAKWALADRSPRKYETGEPLQLLGDQIRLRLLPGSGPNTAARLDDRWLEIALPCIDGETSPRPMVVAAIERWYRSLAECEFPARVRRYSGIAGLSVPRVLIAAQVKRWGSCSSTGVVRLNWRLMMAPSDVVDYVVVHEVCHLCHPHHQRPFWEAVAALMPDFQEPRARLLRDGALYRL